MDQQHKNRFKFGIAMAVMSLMLSLPMTSQALKVNLLSAFDFIQIFSDGEVEEFEHGEHFRPMHEPMHHMPPPHMFDAAEFEGDRFFNPGMHDAMMEKVEGMDDEERRMFKEEFDRMNPPMHFEHEGIHHEGELHHGERFRPEHDSMHDMHGDFEPRMKPEFDHRRPPHEGEFHDGEFMEPHFCPEPGFDRAEIEQEIRERLEAEMQQRMHDMPEGFEGEFHGEEYRPMNSDGEFIEPHHLPQDFEHRGPHHEEHNPMEGFERHKQELQDIKQLLEKLQADGEDVGSLPTLLDDAESLMNELQPLMIQMEAKHKEMKDLEMKFEEQVLELEIGHLIFDHMQGHE